MSGYLNDADDTTDGVDPRYALMAQAQQGATLHAVSDRFMVRIVTEPLGLLYHGMRNDWSRERRSYEEGTIVEVYDRKYVEGFTPLGQFVTAYSARTLLGVKGALSLQGDIPAWTLTRDEVTTLLGLIVQHGDIRLD
jgi:hypothetical protein